MFEELKDKATDIMSNDTVKEVVEKATEFIQTEKGQQVVETIKEKVEDIIKDKLGK